MEYIEYKDEETKLEWHPPTIHILNFSETKSGIDDHQGEDDYNDGDPSQG